MLHQEVDLGHTPNLGDMSQNLYSLHLQLHALLLDNLYQLLHDSMVAQLVYRGLCALYDRGIGAQRGDFERFLVGFEASV